jgi:hypothetical protein
MRFSIPIRLVSLANLSHRHWSGLARISSYHKRATYLCLYQLKHEIPPLPVVVKITRVGPRGMDNDNLASACKYVRDQIAKMIGVDDGSDQYTWQYEQRKGDYEVEVEITSR